ncbi:hypothetical protein C791_5664 [Amycolatopsis azurea DSM 43854]|uniref:Uncharacterized protein n=1 Tax=Amycolatopsis azurea DSM 43854 TaxID=1238180 RepID=M2NQR4_9PSEU|nr:hypothetical protein C791_5664 [Amycolatopsis azurea DSM 43854]
MVGHGWPPPKASARPVPLHSDGFVPEPAHTVTSETKWSGTAMVSREGTIPPTEKGQGSWSRTALGGRCACLSHVYCPCAAARQAVVVDGRRGARGTPGFAGLMTIV